MRMRNKISDYENKDAKWYPCFAIHEIGMVKNLNFQWL